MKVIWELIRKLLGFYTKNWGWGTSRPSLEIEETKPCIICRKRLESAMPGDAWKTNQPWGGGEVKFIFSYGSCKFDTYMTGTGFTGIICDDCAELCMKDGEMTCDQD